MFSKDKFRVRLLILVVGFLTTKLVNVMFLDKTVKKEVGVGDHSRVITKV